MEKLEGEAVECLYRIDVLDEVPAAELVPHDARIVFHTRIQHHIPAELRRLFFFFFFFEIVPVEGFLCPDQEVIGSIHSIGKRQAKIDGARQVGVSKFIFLHQFIFHSGGVCVGVTACAVDARRHDLGGRDRFEFRGLHGERPVSVCQLHVSQDVPKPLHPIGFATPGEARS